MSPTHDLPAVLIQLELSPFCGPHHSALTQDFSPLCSRPLLPQEGLRKPVTSLPCLQAVATLFSVCLLLNMPFLYK